MPSVLTMLRAVFGARSDIEMPAYEVIDRVSRTIEVRRYGPRLAAETHVDGGGREPRREAFQRLYAYLTGANRAAAGAPEGPARIAMTAPVETTMPETRGFEMRFFLPAAYSLEIAPLPTDARVRLVPVPQQTVAVLRFAGDHAIETLAHRITDLSGALDVSIWKPVGKPVAWLYDPPWTLPAFRRNEVAVEVRRR